MDGINQVNRRRRSAAVLASIAIMATLCLQGLTAPNLSNYSLHSVLDIVGFADEGGDEILDSELEMEEEMKLHEDDADAELEPADFRRALTRRPSPIMDGGYQTEDDYNVAFQLANSNNMQQNPSIVTSKSSQTVVQPYSIQDALHEATIFSYTFCIIIYDPPTDKFIGMYSKDHQWKNGNKKLWKSMRQFVYMLRRLFPDRFTPSSPEFVIAFGSGDYPHVHSSKLPHTTDNKAPVLMFGSSFRDERVYPNMMAMPMPDSRHLNCFVEWVQNGGKRVCQALTLAAYGEEREGMTWDKLIPQLVWRGTDFGFLPTLQKRPSLVHPNSKLFVRRSKNMDKDTKRREAIASLNAKYDTLLPRWKGAALTAQAELDADAINRNDNGKQEVLPWANIKFSAYLDKGKSPTLGSAKYSLWESVDIGVGKGMSTSELATYKYHIDLGGGGGTTWSGTLEKLAMPGLLFHHVTPTKDYIHDRLVAWRHYIPVSSDLKDLKSKFDWAELHPQEAQAISHEGTKFMKWLGTPEGYKEMFEDDFYKPLQRVIEAYQPVSTTHPDKKSWRDVLSSMGEECRIMPVMECSGITPENSCKIMDGEDIRQFQKMGRYIAKGAATSTVRKRRKQL